MSRIPDLDWKFRFQGEGAMFQDYWFRAWGQSYMFRGFEEKNPASRHQKLRKNTFLDSHEQLDPLSLIGPTRLGGVRSVVPNKDWRRKLFGSYSTFQNRVIASCGQASTPIRTEEYTPPTLINWIQWYTLDLVLWCFVFNPHRRSPYSEFPF